MKWFFNLKRLWRGLIIAGCWVLFAVTALVIVTVFKGQDIPSWTAFIMLVAILPALFFSIAAIYQYAKKHQNKTETELKSNKVSKSTHSNKSTYNFRPIDIDNYISPSGGYINYAIYRVQGVNNDTGRKNTKTFNVKNEKFARGTAIFNNLNEPFDITVVPAQKPSSNQLDYAIDLGASIPNDACAEDVSTIISRIMDDDINSPNLELAKYADNVGVCFSRFIGANALLFRIVHFLQFSDLATFYVYAVYQDKNNEPLKNLLTHPLYKTFLECGRTIEKNAELMESLKKRPTSDYIKPNKNSKVYISTITMLNLKT